MAPGSAKNKRMAEQSDANNVLIGWWRFKQAIYVAFAKKIYVFGFVFNYFYTFNQQESNIFYGQPWMI